MVVFGVGEGCPWGVEYVSERLIMCEDPGKLGISSLYRTIPEDFEPKVFSLLGEGGGGEKPSMSRPSKGGITKPSFVSGTHLIALQHLDSVVIFIFSFFAYKEYLNILFKIPALIKPDPRQFSPSQPKTAHHEDTRQRAL